MSDVVKAEHEEYSELPGYSYALIGDQKVAPEKYLLLCHGTSITSEFIEGYGLVARGENIDLIQHVEPVPGALEVSAFRGAVMECVSIWGGGASAVDWASEGGLVFQICNWYAYDVNMLLEGRIPDGMGGYRGPLMCAEQEYAIPARVPMESIRRVGSVLLGNRGVLRVSWRNV